MVSTLHGRLMDRRLALLALTLILAVGLFLRIYRLDEVPPGVHDDEIINGEIALMAKQQGFKLFYPAGWGREGLYHVLLAGSFSLPLPVYWQLRLPSVISSLAAMVLTWLWVRRAFGPWEAATAAGASAVLFWPVLLGRAALRATLLPPIAAAAAWMLIRTLEGRKRRFAYCGLALLLGLSLYTYRAARVLPLAYLLFGLYLSVRRIPESRRVWLAVIGTLVLAAPLVVILMSQPDIELRIEQVDRPWRALMAGDVGPVLQQTLATVGMFGWRGDPSSHYNLPGRPVFEPVGAVLFGLGLVVAAWRWREPRYAFVLLWLGIGLLPGCITEPAPHFVHTVVALPAAVVFPGIAVSAVVERVGRRGAWIVGGMLAAWLVGNAAYTYSDYLVHWPQIEEVRGFHQAQLGDVARYLQSDPSTSPVAICTTFLNETDPFWRTGRQAMLFLLSRRDLTIAWYNCESAQVFPRAGAEARYFFLGATGFPAWLPASVLENRTSAGSGEATGFQLMAAGPLADYVISLQQEIPVRFGDSLQFLGYEPKVLDGLPGQQLTLRTVWRVLAPLPRDESIFVHLLCGSETPVAQGDALNLLSDTLQPEDIVIQEHLLLVPPDAPAGLCELSIGVYSRTGFHPRLLATQAGIVLGDHLTIAELNVSKP
jgi:4-amino-4-deoxy-L-arabinose transferase-like glycosyltransferase